METPKSSFSKFRVLDILVILAGFSTIFFLLTNGVPLVQAGWMGELGKKSRYVRLMIVSVAVFSILMFCIRWRWPEIFKCLFWARLWHAVCQIPLRYLTAFFFILYAVTMTAVGFERHLALETRAFDLGIFAQAVWNTLQGDWFFSSIKENINLMGDHVSPILILTVPFYAIWPDPRTLILLQALAAASSLIPLALIARDKLSDRSLVLIFLLMFFFYSPMRAALHEDFHPEVLAEPFLWWAFFFLDKGRVARFLLCLVVAATGKENFLGITFMLGLYAFFRKKNRLAGATVAMISVTLFLWEIKWLVPHLSEAKYFYGGNYASMLSDPVNGIGKMIFDGERWGYAFKVFLPFLYLPFFHLPTLALAAPVFFQNLLSANDSMRSFNYHYFTGMTPFLFISTLFAIDRLRGRFSWFAERLGLIGFILLVVSVIRSGPSEYWFYRNIHSNRSAHTEMIRKKLAGVPPEARVLTHNSLIPQVCNRKYVYQFNYNPSPTKLEFAEKYGADVVIWDERLWEPGTASSTESLPVFLGAGYRVIFESDGFFIFNRMTSGGRG